MNWFVHPWPPPYLFPLPPLPTFPFFLSPFPPFIFVHPPFIFVHPLVLPWHAFSRWSDVPVPCIGYNNPGFGLLTRLQERSGFMLISGETLTMLLWGDPLPCCRLKCTVVTATHMRGVAPCVRFQCSGRWGDPFSLHPCNLYLALVIDLGASAVLV